MDDGRVAAAEARKLPRNVRLLGLASLLNDVASEMIFPLMPQFLIGVLGGNRFHLGVIEGVADSASSLLKLGSGAWSDRAGRRKGFVVFGYALAALARPLVGIVTAPWHLFACRTADRIGKGLRTSPRDALIADSTDPSVRGRAFGFHRAMDHLGAALGPLLASAFLLAWPGELRRLFLLTLVPGLAVVALLALGLRETPAVSPPPERLRLTLRPFDRNFRLYLLGWPWWSSRSATPSTPFCWCGRGNSACRLLSCRCCGVSSSSSRAAAACSPGGPWTRWALAL